MSKMLKIIQVPEFEKELRKRSRLLTPQEIKSKEMQEFFDDLLYTLDHSKEQVGVEGVGLSAVQVNKHIRAFWAYNIKTNKPKLYINPEITILDDSVLIEEEGCLSIPNVTGYVPRPKKIKVRYFDRNANPHEVVLSGYNARIVLHEYDHLEGILFTDRVVRIEREDVVYA